MIEHKKDLFNKLFKNENLLFIVISVLFAIVFLPAKISADDYYYYYPNGITLVECWKWAADQYFTWSSRTLVNFGWILVLNRGKIAWFIYMGLATFVMLKALSLLFVKKTNKIANLFAVCMLMCFPFYTLCTAGWFATSTTYYGPLAYMLLAFVPIKKVLNDEKIKWWECIVYALSLIYGANIEQGMAIILIVYFVAMIYFVGIKKINWMIVLQFILSIVSLLYTMLCPGNQNRSDVEAGVRFPTYNMLDIIDKADVGLSTSLKWLFYDSGLVIIVPCVLFAYLIWNRYEEKLLRLVSMVPVILTVFLGPLKSIVVQIYPSVGFLTSDINYFGVFTAENNGEGAAIIQLGTFFVIVICICVELILLNDSVVGLTTSLTLVLAGVASRAMMGFSPTVYISGVRTYTTMVICIIAVTVQIFANNIDKINIGYKTKEKIECLLWGMIGMSFLNLIFLVNTTF